MLWSEVERLGGFFDPWREFERMRQSLARVTAPASTDFPLINLWVSADNATLTTEIPGIDPMNIEISAIGDTITLKGNRQPEEFDKEGSYHRRERWYGQFAKTVHLPFAVETEKVDARFAKGVLYVSLPRAEADKPRKITIKAD